MVPEQAPYHTKLLEASFVAYTYIGTELTFALCKPRRSYAFFVTVPSVGDCSLILTKSLFQIGAKNNHIREGLALERTIYPHNLALQRYYNFVTQHYPFVFVRIVRRIEWYWLIGENQCHLHSPSTQHMTCVQNEPYAAQIPSVILQSFQERSCS